MTAKRLVLLVLPLDDRLHNRVDRFICSLAQGHSDTGARYLGTANSSLPSQSIDMTLTIS